jgi:two-component system response regulator YesN
MEKKSILLVDDDAVVREIIKSALINEYDVLEASSYSDVLKLLDKPIDLALIDYILLDYDGFDVLEKIREAKPALPAIIMTGYGNEKVAIKALRSEVEDYIKKPLKLSYLKKRLSEIFGYKKQYEDSKDSESREEFILEAIAEHIEDIYSKNLTLDKLAAMAGMSKFKFSKAFINRFKQTFASYLNNLRINHASELLRNLDLNISEVAHAVGYKNVVHFERKFKETYGMTPREYRKKKAIG